MCVGVPAKVTRKMEYSAVVDVDGSTMTVGTIFVDVEEGDWVVVHAGQAMALIDEEQALESLKTWREIAATEPCTTDEKRQQ